MRTELETLSTQDILAWGAKRLVSGLHCRPLWAEGVVLMHQASQVCPGVSILHRYGVSLCRDGEMVDRIQGRMAVDVRVIQPTISLNQQAAQYGADLNIVDPDRCCAIRKVEPMQRMLNDLDAWVTALRRDQGPSRAQLPALQTKEVDGRFLAKLNPMIHWTKAEVWTYLLGHNLPYNPLHDQGYPSVGCAPCTQPAQDPSNERSGRWAGRSKSECGLHTLI